MCVLCATCLSGRALGRSLVCLRGPNKGAFLDGEYRAALAVSAETASKLYALFCCGRRIPAVGGIGAAHNPGCFGCRRLFRPRLPCAVIFPSGFLERVFALKGFACYVDRFCVHLIPQCWPSVAVVWWRVLCVLHPKITNHIWSASNQFLPSRRPTKKHPRIRP